MPAAMLSFRDVSRRDVPGLCTLERSAESVDERVAPLWRRGMSARQQLDECSHDVGFRIGPCQTTQQRLQGSLETQVEQLVDALRHSAFAQVTAQS